MDGVQGLAGAQAGVGRLVAWGMAPMLVLDRCSDASASVWAALQAETCPPAVAQLATAREVWRGTIAPPEQQSCVHCVSTARPAAPSPCPCLLRLATMSSVAAVTVQASAAARCRSLPVQKASHVPARAAPRRAALRVRAEGEAAASGIETKGPNMKALKVGGAAQGGPIDTASRPGAGAAARQRRRPTA